MSKKAHNRRHWLTEGIAKFWWVMSILFVVLSIAVVLALRCGHSHWVQAVVVAGWLLFVPLLLVQLIILAVIRCWGKLVASSAVGVASVGIGENRDKADMAFRYDVACCGAMACN